MRKSAAAVAVGALSGLGAYKVYSEVGTVSAILVLVLTGWFILGLTDPERFVGRLEMLLNPPITSFMAFSGSFIYFSFNGYPGPDKFLAATGVAALGAIFSFLVYKYWNIG